MATQELTVESEWLLKAVNHQLRRKMLLLIAEHEKQTYTELLEKLDLTTGKLNFHLKPLIGLIEKDDEGNYILTIIGKKAIEILEKVSAINDNKEQIEFLQSKALATSLRIIQPAGETKKKWYFWIIVIILVGVWIPLVGTISIVEFDLQIFTAIAREGVRKLVIIGILTVIITIVIVASCFVAKKYLESIAYEIMDTEITIKKGLIVKKKAVIPFRTITNLVIKQGPIDYLLGIASVIIQTAGEGTKSEPEGKLVGIFEAKDLLEEILNLVRLLDPPSYLKEKISLTTTPKNIIQLYGKILAELEEIDKKLT